MKNTPHPYYLGFRRVVVMTGFFVPCMLDAVGQAEEATTLEPITVRAPREEKVRSAVTAYDGMFLEANGVDDYQSLAELVPGFFVSAQSIDFISLNVRGLTSDETDPRVQPRVSVFQDGVGLNNVHGNGVALFDIDHAAVFKGPQATRFGEGVQSGALALVSNRARNESTASLKIGAGDFNAHSVEAHVNRPVVADKLFARVAVQAKEREGYVKNLAGGPNLQGEGTLAARTSLRWEPSVATTADLVFNVQRDDTAGVAFKSAIIPVSPGSTDTDPYRPTNLNRGSDLGVFRTLFGLTGIVQHQLDDSWTLVSTSAWRELSGVNEFDGDGSYLYLIEVGERFSGRQLSHELRFEFDRGERFTASVGANVLWNKNDQRVLVRTDENAFWTFFTGLPPPFPLNPNYTESHVNEAETMAADLFGRADYKLTDRFTLGGGWRLKRERIVSGYQSFAAPVAGSLPVPLLPTSGGGNIIYQVTPGHLENSDEVNSWAAEVDARFEVTPRLTAYASVSRGRRTPVLDFDLLTLAPRETAEETVWNYEAGVRGASAGQRLRYDLSVFQYYFDHFQTQRVVPPGVVQSFDGGRARGRGFEASVQADLSRELSVFAVYGFTDAGFSAKDDDGNPQLYGGDFFRLTSRHVVSIGSTLSIAPGGGGTVFFTPLYTYRSEYFFEDNNAQNGGILRQGGYGLVNLRLGYRSRNQRWEIVTYANNVFGKNYLLDSGNIGGNYGIPTNVPAEPRMIGVNATMQF